MHIRILQEYMMRHHLDWVVVPREDEFLGEYVPPYNERLRWVTGFSGSAGVAFVSQTAAYLFVDSRYTLQAVQESPSMQVLNVTEMKAWMQSAIQPSATVGINLRFHHLGFVQTLQKTGAELQWLDPHPVDILWDDRPHIPDSQLIPHPLEYAGESIFSKRSRVVAALAEGAEALYVSDPHDVAWLLNLRGNDLDYTPIALARALIWRSGQADLWCRTGQVSADILTHLGDGVRVHPLDHYEEGIRKPTAIQVDPSASAYDLKLLGGNAVVSTSPIPLMKAIKNPTEIQGMRLAHQADGVALRKFITWLQAQPWDHLDEIVAADQLEHYRRECLHYRGPSFPTISAFGSNGAIVHYRSNHTTNRSFEPHQLYLVDSGAQYPWGTTDITRTFAIGQPTIEQKRAYTLVLKGHIRLAQAVFPKGTTGHQLDAFARMDLWQQGLDYGHGTGHGVGSFLSVHEGPQSISPRMNATPLQPGMVLSNEPGYYKTGGYGIRIENMMVVQESEHPGFLCFETLTQVPYDDRLIDTQLLTDQEKAWVATYR